MSRDVATNSEAAEAGCTIVSKNYFGFARTVAQSFKQHHPEGSFFILVVDSAVERERFASDDATVIFLEDLGVPDWRSSAFRFDIMELNTNVKPSVLQYVFHLGFEKVVYLDPDIWVYGRLEPVWGGLDCANIALTPHTLEPIEDDLRPTDRDFLKCGVYNLGFIGLRRSEETTRFLAWWARRCLHEAFSEVPMGWFVDQKWIDLVPCYFDNVTVLRHRGCNMAYWNLHERRLTPGAAGWCVNQQDPLIFYHFSGIDPFSKIGISKHQNRFNLQDRPDLAPLFDEYRARLISNGFEQYRSERYAFSTFETGEQISQFLRRVYYELPHLHADKNPFASGSAVHRFARRHGLCYRRQPSAAQVAAAKETSMSVDLSSRKFRRAAMLLRMALTILGVRRFELLLRFMKHFGIANNAAQLLYKPSSIER